MRKRHDAVFKARVALEALKGEKTTAQLSSEYGVHGTQISSWKQELIRRSGEIFNRPDKSGSVERQELADKLHKTIGELKVENDWLKKKLNTLG